MKVSFQKLLSVRDGFSPLVKPTTRGRSTGFLQSTVTFYAIDMLIILYIVYDVLKNIAQQMDENEKGLIQGM